MLYLFTTVRKKTLTWGVFKRDGKNGKWASVKNVLFILKSSQDPIPQMILALLPSPPISFGHCNGNLSKREIKNLPPIQPHGHSSLSKVYAFQLAFQPYTSLQIYGVTSLSWLQWEVQGRVSKCRGGKL